MNLQRRLIFLFAAGVLVAPGSALRSPVSDWTAQAEPQDLFVVLLDTRKPQRIQRYSEFPHVLRSSASALQVESHSKKESANGEKSPLSTHPASQSTQTEEKSSDSESSREISEEETVSSQEAEGGSKSEGTSPGRVAEEESNRSKESHDVLESGKSAVGTMEDRQTHDTKSPASEPSDTAARVADSLAEVPSAHETHVSARGSWQKREGELRPGAEPPATSQTHGAEGHTEAEHGSQVAGIPFHTASEIRNHNVDTPRSGSAEVVPSSERFVVQLNFRPSMVIGRAEADKVDKHVQADTGGTKWYEVIGTKDLTILKLKPIEGEDLLHKETVSLQSY